MRAETFGVESKGEREHLAGRSRRQRSRRGTYCQPSMDVLERRELLATIPATVFQTSTIPISAVSNDGNASAPSITVDPNNPQKLAAVWTQTGGPDLPNGVSQEVKFATSNNGGQSWIIQGTPGGFSFPASYNPTTTNPTVLFTNYNNASVQFDRNDNIYILYEGDLTSSITAPSATGVLLLSKYNFSTGSPNSSAGQGFVNKEVYKWIQDPAISPVLTVDSSVPTFSDPNPPSGTVTQNDPYSGNVYVSWTSTDVAPAFNPTNYDPNRIRIVASTDGGNTFSGVQVLNSNGNFGTNRPATPQTAVSQGSPSTGAGTPAVAPGQITTVWDDWGVGATASPPFDEITSNRITDGAAAQTFASANNIPIGDAGAGTPNIPNTTNVPITVNITDPRFLLQSITDVTVNMSVVDPALNELQIVLVPPVGSGLPSLVLVENQTNAAGTANTGIGISGANLGIAQDGEGIGTTFDDNATRNIVDINNAGGRGAAAPFIGFFQPEAGSLNQNYTGSSVNTGPAGTAGSINGQWTLQFTDFRNDSNPVQSVRNSSITFTAGFSPGVQTNVAPTFVRAAQSGAAIGTPADPAVPISAAPSLASDNTLGAFSPNQGRLYVAYVDRNRFIGNPALNTDIFLAFSDDGGLTWNDDTDVQIEDIPVNDDNATTDGFSEGSLGLNTGRSQFQPNVAVDPITGTVALSWYDARFDAQNARVVTETTTSIDGGQTFSPDTFANDSETATDTITGNVVTLAPIPDNQASSTEPIAGFGVHEGLAIFGGKLYPIWTSNQNGGRNPNAAQPLGIRTNIGTYNAGPGVVSVTQGPIGGPNDNVNTQTAADGTPELTAFDVTFDRPINPLSFTPSDVRVFYRDTTATNATGGFIPVSSVVPIVSNGFGATEFLVSVPARSGVGTYSVTILNTAVSDDIRSIQNTVVPVGGTVTFNASDLPQTVGSNSTVFSAIDVPAGTFAPGEVVSSVTVTIGSIVTADASSLSLTLISPDGTSIPLSNHAPFAFAGGQNYTGTLFSDSAPQSINQGVAPFNNPSGYQPISPLNQLSGETLAGDWFLEVSSSLSPLSATFNSWSLNIQAGALTTTTVNGNSGITNFQTGAVPGQPYATGTLPLIIPGPHVVSTDVNGVGATPDNLVLDQPVSSLDINFDREMNATTFTPADVLRIMGPTGPIVGTAANPIQVIPLINGTEEPNATVATSFRVTFPAQDVSGTYTVTLGSAIQDVRGNALDTNENAGLDLLEGVTTGPTTAATYRSTTPVQIPSTKTVVSTINIPDNFQAQGVTVQLNIASTNDPGLQVTLVSPQNVPIILVPYGTGNVGSKTNFFNTIFDDAATTLISNGAPQFFGSYLPITPLSTLNGVLTQGAWKLIVSDNPTDTTGITSTLNNWSITFQKGSSSSGLGEAVADQYTGSFRIFNTSATNPLASTTWTSTGPASMVDASQNQTNNGFAGSVGTIAVDPSDPSGNTVYVAGINGGVWKTTDFLTTAPQGPTYIPLTAFGPTSGLYISSNCLFPRNNDPNQTIIIAGTGDAATEGNNFFNGSVYGQSHAGVGFLKSMDGGATWTLLDSMNNNLPFASRDHFFSLGSVTNSGSVGVAPTFNGGVTIMKVVADPHLTPNGSVILYAAVSANGDGDGGLYRSTDTGQTWQKMAASNGLGDASDVTLDLASATINAVSNPTGNVNSIYVAFPGHGVYLSPNRGQVLNIMAGGGVDPLIVDVTRTNHPQIAVGGPNTLNPGGADQSTIVLAKPALVPSTDPRSDIENTLYEGWLYAAVTDVFENGVTLYVTKDYGQTWTVVGDYGLPDTNNEVPKPVVPTNNGFLNPTYNPTSSPVFQHSSYNVALTVDATNPNIIYLGGTANGNESGLVRIDITKIYDSHAEYAYNGNYFDITDPLQPFTTGGVNVDNNTFAAPEFIGTSGTVTNVPGQYLNLLTDPGDPFNTDATLWVTNTASFVNSGAGVTWIPEDEILLATGNSFVPSSNIHQIITTIDPLTGETRLIVADDQGVFTGVINPDGSVNFGTGVTLNPDGSFNTDNAPNSVSPTFSRNGNLAIAQLETGASQASIAVINTQVSSLFYGNGLNLGTVASDGNILTDGNTVYTGSTNGSTLGVPSVTSADQNGTGVAVGIAANGDNLVYQYLWPSFGGNKTDFFQVSVNGSAFISRTTGLEQVANDPQWPGESPVYPNGLVMGNFAVNPIDGDQVMISSAVGRVFATINQGKTWQSIGEPGSLDGSYASALAFGAPDPNGPAGIGNLNNFLYAGTVDGHIFVSQTGGGSTAGGNGWTNISTGLDGSPVEKIITDPNRGMHDAYAVTQKGVYYMANSTLPTTTSPTGVVSGPTWINISGTNPVTPPGTTTTVTAGNLFSLQINPFGNPQLANTALSYLTSIQADWRYVIPNNPKGPNPTGTHPVLFVSGNAGVYESIDNGTTWTVFPNQAFNGAPADGGYLPNVVVNDLTIANGAIDPTNGQPVTQAGDPDTLLASTGGLGQYMIRIAPIVFPSTLALDTKLPAPGGSVNGKDAQGLPIVRTSVPVFDGLSEQSAFGNTVRITILDETNPNNPVIIGGYNPNLGSTNNPTDIPANYTNAFGNFQVQVSPTGFLTTGIKTIGIQATDPSGTVGNIATIKIDLQATLTSITALAAPVIILDPASDSSGGQGVTNDTTPQIDGTTSPNAQVVLNVLSGPGYATVTQIGTTTADNSGNFTFQMPSLQNGTFVLQAIATNTANNLMTTGPTYSFQVKTVGPQITPSLSLLPASDTGIPGDNITSDRRPFFIGTTDPNALVSVYTANAAGNPTGTVLATATADSTGKYTIQLPFSLFDGPISLVATVHDLAGNPEPPATPLQSPVLTITEVSVISDYTATGMTTPAVFRRQPNGAGVWFIYGVPPAGGTSFGGATVDIPFTGDFDGDGKADLALFRPSTDTWFIQQSSRGFETFSLGSPGPSLPSATSTATARRTRPPTTRPPDSGKSLNPPMASSSYP